MIFLCGLFFPVERLPLLLRPVSYLLPLTYGADVLHGAVNGRAVRPVALILSVLALFRAALFLASLGNIKRKWILQEGATSRAPTTWPEMAHSQLWDSLFTIVGNALRKEPSSLWRCFSGGACAGTSTGRESGRLTLR